MSKAAAEVRCPNRAAVSERNFERARFARRSSLSPAQRLFCGPEIAGWSLEVRRRTHEATALVERAMAACRIDDPGGLTLAPDNLSAAHNVCGDLI